MKNKLWKWLQLWDGVWSVPLAFVLFVLAGIAGASFFGDGFGWYDPSVFQAAMIAGAVLVFVNITAWLGIYMNFRAVYRYYKNDSVTDFKQLKVWQRLLVLGLLYACYIIAAIVLFLKLV
jgi:NADH:ubiquinone oxidoreductase subunit H